MLFGSVTQFGTSKRLILRKRQVETTAELLLLVRRKIHTKLNGMICTAFTFRNSKVVWFGQGSQEFPVFKIKIIKKKNKKTIKVYNYMYRKLILNINESF